MAITVHIAGVDRSSLAQKHIGISWQYTAMGRGTGKLVLKDVSGAFVPTDGQEVLIKEDGTTRFAGILVNPKRSQIISVSRVTYVCAMTDYTFLLDKRRVWRDFEDELFEDCISYINANFLDGEGITENNVGSGPRITVTFNGCTAAQAFDELVALAEEGDGTPRAWWIDVDKDLHAKGLAVDAFPAGLTTANVLAATCAEWTERKAYRNTQFVRAGDDKFPIVAEVADAGEIAARAGAETGSGIYEALAEEPDIKTEDEATAAAEAMLDKHMDIPQYATVTTRTSGFAPGQQGTVTLPTLGLAGVTMNIESVNAMVPAGMEEIRYTLKLTTGNPQGGWQSSYRKPKRQTIPLRFEPTPGVTRIEPLPGAIIHDPDPAPTEWFAAPQSGVLDDTPSGIGIDHFERWMFTVRRLVNDTVFEEWAINASTHVVATSPTYSTSWAELLATATFKTAIAVAPYTYGTLRVPQYAAIVHYGAPGKLIVVSVGTAPLFLGSVNCTMSAQANGGEPVWVGRYLYWPNVTDGKIFIYDLGDPTTPLEVGSFLTSLPAVFALRVSSDDGYLYAFGTGGIVALDLTDPEAPGPAATSGALTIAVDEPTGTFTRSAGNFEDNGFAAGQVILSSGYADGGNNAYWIIDTVVTDTITVTDSTGMVTEGGTGDEEIDAIEDGKVAPTGSYVSGDLSEDDDLIVAGTRIDAANVRITTIDVAGGALTLNTEKSIALATPAANIMTHAILSHSSFIVWSERNVSTGANSLKAYVFKVKNPVAPTFVETISYVHAGAAGNLGPVNSQYGRLSVVTFNFNSDAQVTWGDIDYDKVKPLEVERPLRESFGGTGHGGPDDEYLHGDSLWAEDFETLGKLAVGPDGSIVLAAAAETLGVRFANRDFYNGTVLETFDALVTSDGAVVTMSLEQSGGGDLTMRFSDGWEELDCDPAPQTIVLTAGADNSPTENFIYVLQSTKELTKDTSAWPATEHIKVAYFFVPSAAKVQAEGTFVNQNWNEHDAGTDGQGHMSHMAERERRTGARYFSGIDPNGTQGYLTPGAGTTDLKSTAGLIYQLHRHVVPAVDTSGVDDVHVVNWSGDAYHEIVDLFEIEDDSTGTPIPNNRYFNLIYWGVANKPGEYAPAMINLPGGFYVKEKDALSDTNGFDVFVIPKEFITESSTGFLIARITIKMGGTWSDITTTDLRGFTPLTATGGVAASLTSFADNVFDIFDEGDPTKILNFEASGITAGNTRVLTVPDKDGTIALIATVMSRISMRF